jgi:hypothetical protein
VLIVQLTNSDDVPVRLFRRVDAEERVHSSFLPPNRLQRPVRVHTVLVEAIFANHFAESFM